MSYVFDLLKNIRIEHTYMLQIRINTPYGKLKTILGDIFTSYLSSVQVLSFARGVDFDSRKNRFKFRAYQ